MYDIRDILSKGIMINEKKKEKYLKLQENSGDIRIRTLLGVFIRESVKEIAYINRMKENITDQMAEAIDFSVFDKVSSLVNQFSRTIVPVRITDRKVLLNHVLEQEKATYALLIDIQGRLVTSPSPMSVDYYALLELIEEKSRYIEELKRMT